MPVRTALAKLLSFHTAPIGATIAASMLLMVSACQSTPAGPPLTEIAERVNSTLEPNTVVLGVGDTLEVRFPFAPTWNHEAEITLDGSASFLAVGRLMVAGMSPGALNQALTDAYAHVLENADLDVVIKQMSARRVYVTGEVLEPGEFELESDRRITLLDAIARAGGFKKETANLSHTLLVRWSASTGKQLTWKIDASPEYWEGSVPLYLQPYDLVYVPNSPVDEVAIWVDNYIRRMIPFPYIIPPIQY